MSLSTHAQHLRGGTKMGGLELVDTMIKDGLTDVFNNYHMGITAENLAEQYQVTRDDQDAFATASQNKASKARAEGRFKDEIAPVTVKTRKGETVVDATNISATASSGRRSAASSRRSRRTAASPPAMPRGSTTAPPLSC